MSKCVLVIHGGAGSIGRGLFKDSDLKHIDKVLRRSLKKGRVLLEKGGSALDAVVAAVRILEDSPWFNAGKGSVLNARGKVEMDASVMVGNGERAGAVSGVTKIKNPVLAARHVMEHSPHVFLSGKGAESFAKAQKLKFCSEEYFLIPRRKEQLKIAKKQGIQSLDHTGDSHEMDNRETVGAVALDGLGHLAAATSTGGLTNKLWGRVSDTSVIGAGNYANELVAVSCTGTGDRFLRACAAVRVADRHQELTQSSLEKASQSVLDLVKNLGGEGGLIALDRAGNVSMPFNTLGMFRGHWIQGQSEKTWSSISE